MGCVYKAPRRHTTIAVTTLKSILKRHQVYTMFFFFFFTIVSYNFNKTPINLNYSADYVFSALNI